MRTVDLFLCVNPKTADLEHGDRLASFDYMKTVSVIEFLCCRETFQTVDRKSVV